MALDLFAGVVAPAYMFPHSVAVAASSESPDPGFGRTLTDAAAGPAQACLITDASADEVAAAFARESIRISHMIYFPADPGCKPDDLLLPQDDAAVFFRVQSVADEMRAGLVWTVKALEQTSEV